MNDDPARDYALHMPRAPTEQLVERLREHHPGREIIGWQERNTPPRPPVVVDPVDPLPQPAAAHKVVVIVPRSPRRRRIFGAPSTAQAIVNSVAAEHDIHVEDLIGRSRTTHIVRARQHAMVELRALGLSLPVVGRFLGGRDHTTVLHGIRAHAQRTGGVYAARVQQGHADGGMGEVQGPVRVRVRPEDHRHTGI